MRVLHPPLLIGLSLLLATTLRATTGFLSLVEPWVGMKPTTTERTSPPGEHTVPSSEPLKEKQTQRGKKEIKQKGKAI
jgi:hypothetical protein